MGPFLDVVDDDDDDDNNNDYDVAIHQLHLSLYLMTQCHMKLGLHHPVTSLAHALDYACIYVACRMVFQLSHSINCC